MRPHKCRVSCHCDPGSDLISAVSDTTPHWDWYCMYPLKHLWVALVVVEKYSKRLFMWWRIKPMLHASTALDVWIPFYQTMTCAPKNNQSLDWRKNTQHMFCQKILPFRGGGCIVKNCACVVMFSLQLKSHHEVCNVSCPRIQIKLSFIPDHSPSLYSSDYSVLTKVILFSQDLICKNAPWTTFSPNKDVTRMFVVLIDIVKPRHNTDSHNALCGFMTAPNMQACVANIHVGSSCRITLNVFLMKRACLVLLHVSTFAISFQILHA